jgi:hypothetical protein
MGGDVGGYVSNSDDFRFILKLEMHYPDAGMESPSFLEPLSQSCA